MGHPFFIKCHDCDLIHRISQLSVDSVARCSRCGAVLRRNMPNSLERTLALTVAGLILFFVANAFPFLGVKLQAQVVRTTLISGVTALFHQGMWMLATAVLFTTIVVPLAQLMGVFYVLLPLKFGKRPWRMTAFFGVIQRLQPWSMMEVFMLGILVSIVKLSKMATIIPGVAAYAFMALIFILAASLSVFDPNKVWEHVYPSSTPIDGVKKGGAGVLIQCRRCHLLCRVPRRISSHAACPRCAAPLHRRKPNSVSRTWALILGAMILYIPANVMPITIVTSLGQEQTDTIMSGVLYFVSTGTWPVALVIFVASIVVPILKLAGLIFLLVSVQLKSTWRPGERTRLYRMTETVGRWSMVDVYVVTILVALVHLGRIANIDAGPAALYFCAVVVMTMFAAMSFDPRLIWDNLEMRK